MRPEERDPAYLWDMLEAARDVQDFTAGLNMEDFLASGKEREITRLAVERKLAGRGMISVKTVGKES